MECDEAEIEEVTKLISADALSVDTDKLGILAIAITSLTSQMENRFQV